MLKYGLSAALLVAAVPAFAQAPAPAASGPEAAIQQAGMAFGQCIGTGIQGLAATVTPEAGAATVLRGCTAQRQELERVAESFIAASVPEEQKPMAREQLRTQLGQTETRIVERIRQIRSGAAPAPSSN